jgi:HAD superfamily hydrolase (TIGR01549 family)
MLICAVLFDLDGTITEPLLDFAVIRREIGLAPDCPSVLDGIEGMSPQARQGAMEILCRHEDYAARQSTLQDGAKGLVAELARRNIPTGILTRNSRRSTQLVLEKHGLTFDGIITREDGPVKPDSFGVLTLCRQFGALPENTLVVGDYLHDLLAARNAGAIPVLLTSHPRAREYANHADFCIRHLDEVLQIIDNLRQRPEGSRI